MKKAILGSLAVLPLAAAGVLAGAGVANAALMFNNGDQLQINADFDNTSSNPLELKFFEGTDPNNPITQPLGDYGTFGIGDTSTGFFSFFKNSGETTNSAYKILSVDFTDTSTYLYPDKVFLEATKGGESFQFRITEEITNTFSNPGQDGVFALSDVKGKFVSNTSGQVEGFGFLSGTFIANEGTFSGTLTVESVPEPATMLGLGVVAGSLALTRAGKKNKA